MVSQPSLLDNCISNDNTGTNTQSKTILKSLCIPKDDVCLKYHGAKIERNWMCKVCNEQHSETKSNITNCMVYNYDIIIKHNKSVSFVIHVFVLKWLKTIDYKRTLLIIGFLFYLHSFKCYLNSNLFSYYIFCLYQYSVNDKFYRTIIETSIFVKMLNVT